MTVRILQGDCRDVLPNLADESVHCVVTSPPYFGLRDYGVAGQIGLEPTTEEFVAELVAVFREVRRVLRADGTLWLNLGDSYAGSGRGGYPGGKGSLEGSTAGQDNSRSAREVSAAQRLYCPATRGSRLPAGLHESQRQAGAIGRAWVPPPAGIKQKDLIGIPWMVAFALRADGWHLRQDIIWAKPNPMPESVTDRCTKAHEYLFLLSKSARYYYDAEAIKEPAVCWEEAVYAGTESGLHSGESHTGTGKSTRRFAKGVAGWGVGRNSAIEHSVEGRQTHAQKVKAESGAQAARKSAVGHAGNPKQAGLDAAISHSDPTTATRNKRSVWTVPTKPFKEAHFATFPPALIEPCILAGCPVGGVVLDPFGGAGTTGLVADRLQRDAVLIELNPRYAELADKRITGDAPLLTKVAT